MKLRIWIRRRCDDLGLCEYVEVPLARALRMADKIKMEDLYIIIDDVEPQLLEDLA
ncbi:MAG: hypothetical protein RQ839_06255 [Thermoproteus sp.]|nr:hypothetical protein [Thermoproteus sp.]MDT7882457.1 hypothetical protein [Thermoproteus sp.]